MPSSFWRFTVFKIVAVICGLFVVLTAAAMFIYPGGTNTDKTTAGYSFLGNFFSDLGRTVARGGDMNTPSKAHSGLQMRPSTQLSGVIT